MNKTPPLLPEETLARVMRVARFHGMSVLLLSGLFALISGSSGDKPGVIAGIIAAGIGALELHGVNELQRGEPSGLRWILLSPLAMLVTILGYCSYCLTHVDLTFMQELFAAAQKSDPTFKGKIEETGYTIEQATLMLYNTLYTLISIMAPVYCFVLSFYYLRRRGAVERALSTDI